MSDETTGTVGVGMFVAAYVDEMGADQALDDLKQARDDGEMYWDDAAIVRNDAKGKVHIKETGDMSTGKGAGIGALIGGVVGILGGPAGIAAGAAAGAAIGAIAAHTDGGFDQNSLKEIGGALPPGSSALAVTTSQEFVEAVVISRLRRIRLSLASDIAGRHAVERPQRCPDGAGPYRGWGGRQQVVSSPRELLYSASRQPRGGGARAGVPRLGSPGG